jgi:hypothetical protein
MGDRKTLRDLRNQVRPPNDTQALLQKKRDGIYLASIPFSTKRSKVERNHFRDRKVLLYHEKERQKIQRAMSQDPYLDTAG